MESASNAVILTPSFSQSLSSSSHDEDRNTNTLYDKDTHIDDGRPMVDYLFTVGILTVDNRDPAQPCWMKCSQSAPSAGTTMMLKSFDYHQTLRGLGCVEF